MNHINLRKYTDVFFKHLFSIVALFSALALGAILLFVFVQGGMPFFTSTAPGIRLVAQRIDDTKREELGKEPTFSRNYFIYSMEDATVADLLRTKRAHWSIENNLHWTLDVTFKEDDSRARTDNAAENLNILRKQALQLMKQETSIKGSMRSKRLRCAWDLFYALKVIGVK